MLFVRANRTRLQLDERCPDAGFLDCTEREFGCDAECQLLDFQEQGKSLYEETRTALTSSLCSCTTVFKNCVQLA
eukprot:IDg3076t1